MSFPFTAVVGHPDLRLALLLSAVDPGIGGVLVRGEKGTAKSTIVRALAGLLPEVEVRAGDRFGVDVEAGEESPDGPFEPDTPVERRPARLVELPVGASEDRLIGSLDLQEVLAHGRGSVQPGLLAAAHRGVLYVDEVNLLHDHLVDLLLDAAASGRSHVERDGVSFAHPARFLLVGTMNPEEGELRPQLLDRFGLTVRVAASREVGERTEVVRRRLAYDADPRGFARRFADDEAVLRERLRAARMRLPAVALPDRELVRISAVCAAVEVDGMRADVVLARTAVAHAAWREGGAVEVDDVRAAARLALPHRRRRDPFDEPHLSDEELEKALEAAEQAVREWEDDQGPPDDDPGGPGGPDGPGPDDTDADTGPGSGPDDAGADADGTGDSGGSDSDGHGSSSAPPPGAAGDGTPPTASPSSSGPPAGPGDDAEPLSSDDSDAPSLTSRAGDEAAGRPVGAPAPVRLRTRRFEVRGTGDGAPGRRSRARGRQGRTVRAVVGTPESGPAPHVPATVLASARAGRRGRPGPDDLRHALREGREGNLVLFCVDASGSMAARRRMTAVTGAVDALLRDAYQRRDKVGVVTFRGDAADVALPPTSSVHTAHARLADLRTGGRTPLADGLRAARRVLAAERTRDPRRRGLLIVLTDGRATVGRSARGATALDAALDAARGLARDARPARGGTALSTVVVDCESGPVRLGLAGRVAGAAGGTIVTLDELTGESVAALARAV